MLRFYWTPVVASRAFLLSPPDDSRSTMKQDRFSLCLNNCLLTRTQLSITDSMDTVKISQRFACANEQSKWPFCEIEVGLCAWLGVRCAGPHPPPLSLEFHKRSAIFLRLPDFQCFNPGVRLPYERGGNTEIGSTAHFVYNNIATSHLCLQSLCLPCSRKILQYFEPPNRWLAPGLLQRMKQNINYPRGGEGGWYSL